MKSIADIMAIRKKMQSEIILRDNNDENQETRVIVGMATCGISAGARTVYNALIEEIGLRQLHGVKITRSGCLGMCKLEPIVEVFVPNQEKVTYVHVDVEKAKHIIANHVVNGNICTEYLVTNE